MKSKLIQSGVADNFFDDIVALKNLPVDAFKDLVENVTFSADRGIDSKNLIPVAAKYNVTVDRFVKGLSISISILMNERDTGDSANDVLQDISDLGKIDSSALPDLHEKLAFVRDSAFPRLATISDELSAMRTAFPVLSYFHTRCCMTAKMAPGFDSAKDKPETYTPSVALTVPILAVQMDINSFGEEKSLSFGLTETGLKELVNHLQLAQKELQETKRRFGLIGDANA